MARKYVRDKIGRFAPKGGGSKGKGGKMGKSSKNVKARAAYKKASGKLRSMKKISGGAKDAKDRKFWNKSLGGAKSGMTRVTNRLTKKGAAKAKRGVANPNKLAASKKYAAARKAKKGSAARKDAVSSAKIRRGERRVKAAKKTTAAKKAATAKKKTYKGLTPKQQYKAATSKARAAKSGYAQDRGQGYDSAGKASGKGKVK